MIMNRGNYYSHMTTSKYTVTTKQIALITLLYLGVFTSYSTAQVTWVQLTELEAQVSTRTMAYGDAKAQVIDVFDPTDGGIGSNVLLIHGGCWLSQYDRFYMSHLAKSLSANGMTVYNIGYRRIGENGGGFPGTFEDVQAAYKAVVEDVSSKTGRSEKITVVGHSAGGHLALWLASNDSTVHKVVGLAAISDLTTYARGTGSCQTAAPRLMGGSPDEMKDIYSVSDPMLLGKPKADIVLVSAEKDLLVPPSHNDGYKIKNNARHIVLPNVGHYDLVAPMSTVWKEVLSVINDQ